MSFVLALLVYGGTHEIHHAYTWNLHGVLEGEEDAFVCTVFRAHGKQVLSFERHAAFGHFVCRMSHEYIAQRALACTILSHQGMYFAFTDGQVDTLQYLFAIDAGM